MAKKYKNVPVDEETYERLQVLCERNQRKQGAQVKFWVDTEWGRLELLPVRPAITEAVAVETPAAPRRRQRIGRDF